MENLKKYNQKRDFNKTEEPEGKVKKITKRMLRFVVQKHNARALHYDFRLEWNGVLLSWAVPKGPSMNPKDKRLAVKVEDHPVEYLNFEGNIPKGEYGAGTVEIWDSGNYAPLEDMKSGLKNESLKIVLNGEKLKGLFKLFKIKDDNWLLIHSEDAFASDFENKEDIANNKNVKTKNSSKKNEKGDHDKNNNKSSNTVTSEKRKLNINKKIAEKNKESITQDKNTKSVANKTEKLPFLSLKSVQLATLEKKVPDGDDWIYEVKYDGYRIIAYLKNGKTKLVSRNGNDYTNKFENITVALNRLATKHGAMVLDGEVVVVDENGKTNFGALQNSIKTSGNNFTYIVFDLLAMGNTDLRNCQILERKDKLQKIIRNFDNQIVFSNYVVGNGKKSFASAKKLGLEGIIGKKIDSTYQGTRNGDWIKLKCYNEQEFVIGGFITTEKNKKLSALLLGYYDNKKLVYVGKVGTGFTENIKEELSNNFFSLKSAVCKFNKEPKLTGNITWLKPKLVAQIQYAEITSDNNLRQASFKGIRNDKLATEVVLEAK